MEDRVKRLVVPVSGQRSDERAFRVAARIADRKAIELTLILVVEVAQQLPLDAELPAEIERGEAILRSAEALIQSLLTGRSVHVQSELFQARTAGTAVVDEAIERGTELIVMAGRLRSRHGKVGLGETTKYILRTAPCEVMILRQAMGLSPEDAVLTLTGAGQRRSVR